MTGAPMPARGRHRRAPGAQRERGGWVELGAVAPGANVRARGEDVRTGAAVLRGGRGAAPVRTSVWSPRSASPRSRSTAARGSRSSRPATRSWSPAGRARPGQIYDANRFSLGGLVAGAGADPLDLGIVPDVRGRAPRAPRSRRRGAADVVVTSGGVSVGDYDLVKSVLAEIGGIDFWQVAMQPGRPLAVGRIGGTPVLRPPGQPRGLRPLLPPLRPPRALEARRPDAPRSRSASRRPASRCGRRPGAGSSSEASSDSPIAATRSRRPGPRARASSRRWCRPTA